MAGDYDPSRDNAAANPGTALAIRSDPVGDTPVKNPSKMSHDEILARARDEARVNQAYWGPIERVAQSDLSFLAGHQWDAVDKAIRTRAGRVTLTINDLGQYNDQIIGDLRMNPTQIQVRAADWTSTQAKFVSVSGREYSASEVRGGLIREGEYRCNAPDHYKLAGQHAAETGLGWLRLYHEWDGERSFVQRIGVERIKNRWSVRKDAMATEPDTRDARNGFISTWAKLTDFRKSYPDASLAEIDMNDQGFWRREGYVRLTEYYWLEEHALQLLQLDNGVVIGDDQPEAYQAARVSGRVVNQRKAEVCVVNWALLTYHNVLGEIRREPGSIIPIVPVYGKRLEGDDDDLIYGTVRFAKEPKVMENYWLSSATERVSALPSAPWIVTVNQIKGYETEWANANQGMKAFLPFNVDEDAPNLVPTRPQAGSIPAGEMNLILAFGEKIQGAVGFHNAAVGKATNQQSGKALRALQSESDVGQYVYSDNLKSAVKLVGTIWNSWLAAIYDTERFITVRHENDEVDVIEINKLEEDGTLVNDLSEGRFDVHVDAGPAYSTLRQESAETMLELIKANPAQAPMYQDIMFENMDFPGHERVAKRARNAVPKQLLDPSELGPEEKNAPPTPPTPEQQAQIAEDQAKLATAEATIETANANKIKAKAIIAQAEASMVETLVNSPEHVASADAITAKAGEDQAAAKDKAAGKLPPEMEAMLKELIVNTLAEALAAGHQQEAPQNGGPAGQQPGGQVAG